MSIERQGYAEARLADHEGRALWQALFRDVQEQRLIAPSLARSVVKLLVLSVLLAAALALGWGASSWLERVAAWGGLALLLAQFAFIGHDAGHGSIARLSVVNRALGQLAMTLVTGLAFNEWIARHREHHQYCQDEARDPDMDVAVVVSLTAHSRTRKGALGRFMTRYQAVHVWLLSFFFGHSQRYLSQAVVLAHPRRHGQDAAMLLLHYGLWFGVPCVLLQVPFSAAVLAYVVPLTLLGPYLAAIFWVNHIGMPLVRRVEDFSFFEHQVLTSRTILNPPGWNWLFGGLNFQIEHHLFPQVPSCRLPALQPIVRELFARQRIAYNGMSWGQAVRMIAAHFRRVARAA
ncbi:MAG: fatty acid desaturase family protein [Burkholderiales bacterium]